MTISTEVIKALERHSVIVNEGSGVLIQPASDEYSYVLTANHVIEDKNREDVKIKDTSDTELTVIDLYSHDSLDAAVIKIEKQDDLQISAYSDHGFLPPQLKLRGFPGKNRQPSKSIKDELESYNLQYVTSSDTQWTYRNESNAPYEDVVGCSGGGIFYSESYNSMDEVFIAGVENSLPGRAAGLEHDHIGCIPINVFKDIIRSNDLAELKPLHLMGFQYLEDAIFPPIYYEHILEFEHEKFAALLNWVKAHCKRDVGALTFNPNTLLNEYRKQFIVNSRKAYELDDEKCWFKFLEFLTIISIVNDQGFSELSIDELFKQFKIIYIRSDRPWTTHFQDVLTVDTKHLSKDGVVLLFIGDKKGEDSIIPKETVERCVQRITDARSDTYAIDAAEAFRNKGHTLIHWPTLHHDKVFSGEFEGLTRSEQKKEAVQELYREYLKFKDDIDE